MRCILAVLVAAVGSPVTAQQFKKGDTVYAVERVKFWQAPGGHPAHYMSDLGDEYRVRDVAGRTVKIEPHGASGLPNIGWEWIDNQNAAGHLPVGGTK